MKNKKILPTVGNHINTCRTIVEQKNLTGPSEYLLKQLKIVKDSAEMILRGSDRDRVLWEYFKTEKELIK